MRIAAIEAGGTKFNCALMDGDGTILHRTRIETKDPETTLTKIRRFYALHLGDKLALDAVGLGSFGPLDLDEDSPSYGMLVSTPKSKWTGVNLKTQLMQMFGAPVYIDTDVNCAAIAEGKVGAAAGLKHFCYVTIGTGIGVGVVINGKPLKGAGHMRIPRAPGDDFQGCCIFHNDCLEGLASGPAIEQRWGKRGEEIDEHHECWEIEAYYIALLCMNLTLSYRPQRIILGGGVMSNRPALYKAVRMTFTQLLAGYAMSRYEQDADIFISEPELIDPPSGLLGAFLITSNILADD